MTIRRITQNPPIALPARAMAVLFGGTYAWWLRANQGRMEPDYTWAEVVVGVSVTLALAYAEERWDKRLGSGVATTLVYFGLTGVPVIVGQILEDLERRAQLRAYEERNDQATRIAIARAVGGGGGYHQN